MAGFRCSTRSPPNCLGYSAEELIGRSYLDLVRPDFQARVRHFYRQQLTRRLSHTYLEFPALAKNGSEVWFGQNVEIIEENGRVTGFQAITRDITSEFRSREVLQSAREELEQRVRERTAELESANELLRTEMSERQKEEAARRYLEAQIQHTQRLESLGVLAGGIAHDFNNILTAIMGFASLALPRIPESSGARANIEDVISAARNAAQLTQQMLAYSGRGKFMIEPVNLSRLIEDAARLIATLVTKKATLELKLAADLPAVEGDAAQLRQVLINLLTNVSDALGERPGTIRVSTGTQYFREGELASVRLNGSLPGGRYVFVEVFDTGCGMDPGMLAKIFDPFFTTKFTGRGLGLAAVHGIVRGHKGTLQVQSEPGGGTVFRVLFPAVDRVVEETQRAHIVLRMTAGASKAPCWSSMTNRRFCHSPARSCSGRAPRCSARSTGTTGCASSRPTRQEIRIVLLDLTMPGLDGGEVFQRMIQLDPGVKVILCSGYDEQDVNSKCGPIPPAGFLRKPFTSMELIRTFRSVG